VKKRESHSENNTSEKIKNTKRKLTFEASGRRSVIGQCDLEGNARRIFFISLGEARWIATNWLHEYNTSYPHASLGNQMLYKFAANRESVYL